YNNIFLNQKKDSVIEADTICLNQKKDSAIKADNKHMLYNFSCNIKRLGHFSSIKLLGGDASTKEADITLFSYMMQAKEQGIKIYQETECIQKNVQQDNESWQKRKLQEMAWKHNINTIYSSSMGRLFDAISALLEICNYNSYEGECAILLEQKAHKGKEEFLQLNQKYIQMEIIEKKQNQKNKENQKNHEQIELLSNAMFEKQRCKILPQNHCDILKMDCKKNDGVWIADSVKLVVDLYHLKLTNQYSTELLAYFFHHAVAMGIVELAEHICKEHHMTQVALSGGSFINRILLTEVMECLQQKGKQVYINEKVPCGDGGIALGQIYLLTFLENQERNCKL
ncbi:MAG: hypothetical protein IKJ01_02585, partial [Lachnospiraceae bacterium]|nr:hypothetical protein [Lachnospiraceae bacterium]